MDYKSDTVQNSQIASAQFNLSAQTAKIIYDSKSLNYSVCEQNAVFNEISKTKINKYKNPVKSIESLKGFVFEFFVVNSYNTDAIKNNSPIRAFLTQPNHPQSDIILKNTNNNKIVARIQTKSGKTSLKCLSSPTTYLKYLSNEHLIVTSESFAEFKAKKHTNTFFSKLGDRINSVLKFGGNSSKPISNSELKQLTKHFIQNDVQGVSSSRFAYLSEACKRKSNYLFKIFKTGSKGLYCFSVAVSAYDNYSDCCEGKQSVSQSSVNFLFDVTGVNTVVSICKFLYNNNAGTPFFGISEIYNSEPAITSSTTITCNDTVVTSETQQNRVDNCHVENSSTQNLFVQPLKAQGIELLHDLICVFIQSQVGKDFFETNHRTLKKALINVFKKNLERIFQKISSSYLVHHFQLLTPGLDTCIETVLDLGLLLAKGGTKQELCNLLAKGMGATFTNAIFHVPIFVSSSLSCYVANHNLLILKSELDINVPIYYVFSASVSVSSLQLNKRQVFHGVFVNANAFGKNGVGMGVSMGTLEENDIFIRKHLRVHKQVKKHALYLYGHFGILSKHLFCNFGVNYKKNVQTRYFKNAKVTILPIHQSYSHNQNVKDIQNRPVLEQLAIKYARDLIGMQDKAKGMGYEQTVCQKKIEESKLQGVSSCGRRSNIDAEYVVLSGFVNKPSEQLNEEPNQDHIGTFEHESYNYTKKIRLKGGTQKSSCRVAFFKFNQKDKTLGPKEYATEYRNHAKNKYEVYNRANRTLVYRIKLQNKPQHKPHIFFSSLT